ncbi:E3 ubiquitin-protein ligase sina-like isoform X2 [Plodia interpunctella]|uniref:E3 ubiquitin-protein ligase sina-like isoform X2 n=1 Tax=Plodia interpunctella TaxID=58824 RepID=UPI0023684050|nr:E3 ubiquitin-protein ligase sina-like isoform X2 [Plodia interpunctella]
MAGNPQTKADALPDLDDLLQCPVCYEIPTGQIFQCNEGHHVCGRCKARLDMCPVCRALFFGTRNYAMEELIANVRKLRAFKLGGKITTGTDITETPEPENSTAIIVNNRPEEEGNNDDVSESSAGPPQACKGLFRCLCCKNGNGERLPAARLLNHLRYYHAPDLLEGQSENGEYLQLWQFSTAPGRIVTAVRVSDMGIFFLIIEMTSDSISAWLSMAASPWVAHVFSYTVTISGNDREAIFSDCVWSVRSCEGSLKKRGHCLMLNGLDARALLAPASISGKLSIRRTPADQLANQAQPRAVLRVASRGNAQENGHATVSHDLEPFLQGIERSTVAAVTEPQVATSNNQSDVQRVQMSRNARRRMRQRLRAALNATQPPADVGTDQRANGLATSQRQNGHVMNGPVHFITGLAIVDNQPPVPPTISNRTNRRRRHRR